MAKKGEHHGGAWKVAFADFMTAMMALFMVLWITAQDKEILIATSMYFKQPFSVISNSPIGVVRGKDNRLRGDDKKRSMMTTTNLELLTALAKELDRMLNIDDAIEDSPADVEVTQDGLRVTLYDRSTQPLFVEKTAKFTQWGTFAMENLAWLIERNNLRIVIDGHAASGTLMPTKDYGLWELTADRANAARRAFELYAVAPSKIERVTGYADTKPLPNLPAASESNQRLTVSLSLD